MPNPHYTGPIGALQDEYEKAAAELKELLRSLTQEQYQRLVDTETEDPDCRSVQSIMNHVVRSGYGYANYIRQQWQEPLTPRQNNYELPTPEAACRHLDAMLAYTYASIHNKAHLTTDDLLANIITTTWQQRYDFEQLLEHAIVHILRHRRQIEGFKLKMIS